MPFGFPERLFPRGKYDAHRMRIFALAISWISIIYNGIEGGVSIGFGADVGSRALIVFGIQSFVEVLSAALVIYRFRRELADNFASNLSLERRATLGIGVLFIVLTIGTWAASIIGLVTHAQPDSSKPSLIVSAASLACMIFVWLPKPWIAAELNSSVMRGEAACSLACIYLTTVLFVGSLIYKLWHGGWWIDSALALILSLFFLREGWEMIAWARHKDFNGGCCKACSVPPAAATSSDNATTLNNCDASCSETCHMPPTAISSGNAATVESCNKNCCKTSSANSAAAISSDNAARRDNCNGNCSQTCHMSPAATVSSNAATVESCNKSCCKTSSATSAAAISFDNTARFDSCDGNCSQTCHMPPATTSSDDAAIVESGSKSCCKTSSAIPVADICSNDATISATEHETVEKCNCCSSKMECIEAGTCVCKPVIVDKTSSIYSLCCSGTTKCCKYGMIAAF